MKYYEIDISFKNRNRLISECFKKMTTKISDKTDLIMDDFHSDIFAILPIENIVSIDLQTYRETLFRMKKILNLENSNEVLKLILKRDKAVVETVIKECTEIELKYVLAALTVFSDTYINRRDKLRILISKNRYEEFKDAYVHHFFRVYHVTLTDERMLKFPEWLYFARKIALKKKC